MDWTGLEILTGFLGLDCVGKFFGGLDELDFYLNYQ